MSAGLRVVGIGNALVDVLTRVEDDFLAAHAIPKGVMSLIDAGRAARLYAEIGPAVEISGGSGANTIAALAMLGDPVGYVGKVADDQLGDIFAHDLTALGVHYATPRASAAEGTETGRCLVLVTPDGERTMNTFLGVSERLAPADIDAELVAGAEWLYLEGYRFDGPDSHEAFALANRIARSNGTRIAATLSDPFCVERHRAAFRRMVREDLDLLFANEAEALSLYETASLDEALAQLAAEVPLAAVTVSERGAYVVDAGTITHVPTKPAAVVDATGAGDLFAAGFLHGLGQGRDAISCARMGAVCAAEIISHIGARPQTDLRTLLAEAGF